MAVSKSFFVQFCWLGYNFKNVNRQGETGGSLELGAQWIHGGSEENSVWREVKKKANLVVNMSKGEEGWLAW